MGDLYAKEDDFVLFKSTFGWAGSEAVFLKAGKDLIEYVAVFLKVLCMYQDIINVDKNFPSCNFPSQYIIHKSLEGQWCIREAKLLQ